MPAESGSVFRPRRTRPPRRTPLASFGRWLLWHRRALAVVCAVAAVLCTLLAARPAPDPGVPVVVAAKPLSGGAPLSAADLKVVSYPTRLAPTERSTDPAALIGRVLTAPVSGGTPLSELSVVSPRAGRGADDQVLAPIRLTDPGVATLLRVGDAVDVLATPIDQGTARVVARGARVAALPGTGTGAGPFATEDSRGALLLLEVQADAAPSLAQNSGRLSIVLR
ncbi:Flp pilus assembly protein CpaB [Enemella evansiae]|uniref:SAF domain-containing protein n=1 Tax=Enemella evansiae TaxID=2016499 RepID=UPI000B9663F2|nr:SAF domain-containing protein [Enemella evansiae]OYO08982.1 Flp pilus assembly protein CpaB [Enemella evansiae]